MFQRAFLKRFEGKMVKSLNETETMKNDLIPDVEDRMYVKIMMPYLLNFLNYRSVKKIKDLRIFYCCLGVMFFSIQLMAEVKSHVSAK